MPRILRTGGVNLTDDVVRIGDVGPAAPPRRKKRPAELSEEGEDRAVLVGSAEEMEDADEADFEPAEGYEPEPVAGLSRNAIREEIVQGAMAEAGRILQDAVQNAERTREEYMQRAQAELEELKREVMAAGRAEARDELLGEAKQLAGRLEEAVALFEAQHAAYEAEHEAQLKWLAIEIASKVLAKKVSDDDAEMTEMVDKAVQSVRSEPWIRIEVSSEMQALVDSLTRLYDSVDNVEVSAVPAEPGTVHIETPSGVVDASLKTQLDNLRHYFSQN